MVPLSAVPSPDLFEAFFDLSQMGGLLLRPVREAGEVVDFAYVRLNPAAQRILALPECPSETLLTRYPHATPTGVFAFYRDAYVSEETRHGEFNYQHDGLATYFRLAARRVGEQLLVSFTDTSEQPRTAVAGALRESQAREHQSHSQLRAAQNQLYEAALPETEQRHLHQLNQELESQVAERTQQLEIACQTVQAQRADLARVFEQAAVGFCMFKGPMHIIDQANPEIAAIWGVPLEQLLGQAAAVALPAVLAQGFEPVLRSVFEQGLAQDLREIPVQIDRQGKRPLLGYYNSTFRPQYDAQGHITGIISLTQEITEVVLASSDEHLAPNTALGETQQQLRQPNAELEARVAERTRQLADQQALLQQIQSKVPAYLATFSGPNHVYTYFNEAFARDLTQGRAQLGRAFADLFPELIEQGFLAVLDGVYATGQPFISNETPVVLIDPLTQQVRTLYVNVSYHLLRTEAGDPQGLMAFATDVTAQVLAQRERDTQRQQLQTVFAQAPMAVCVFRGEANVLDVVNPPMAEMLGHPLAALVGQPFFDVLPELRAQQLPALLAEVRRSGIPFVAQEQPIQLTRHQPGEPGYFNFVYQPLLADDGVQGVVCVAFEVTEQVLARQQVQSLNEELAAINEEMTATNEELHTSNTQLTRTNTDLDTFVYTASHDLKAPITNIEGILNALRDTLPAEVQQDAVIAHLLGLLDHTVGRFLTTIIQLTDLTRLQHTYDEPAERLALAPIVAGVAEDLAPAIEAAAAQLHLEVPAALHVSFAPASLRSIVYNLLSNAVKYRDPARPAQVWLRAATQPGAVVLTVRDNGLGLADSQQQRLFGVFQRLHTHVEGTGVGLYMIKRLIENAGATIAVTSELGVGSTFTVTFPA